jgi:hypothetical protein
MAEPKRATISLDDLRSLIREELRSELRAELRSELRLAMAECVLEDDDTEGDEARH